MEHFEVARKSQTHLQARVSFANLPIMGLPSTRGSHSGARTCSISMPSSGDMCKFFGFGSETLRRPKSVLQPTLQGILMQVRLKHHPWRS